MFETVRRLPVDKPSVYAFEISGKVTSEAMESMAQTMNKAFDSHDGKIDLVLLFRNFEGSESGGMWDGDVISSRFRALSNVDHYVVVGAPDSAEKMINIFGKLIPVKAHTFDVHELDQAWALVGAKPMETAAG